MTCYCFAGGTGIAGLMSILSSAAVTGHFERFGAEVYFGVRRSVDAFFLDRLSELVDRHPDAIRVTVALSDEAVPYVLSSRHRSLRFIEGMLHDVIANHPPQLADEPSVFVGGPPAAVDSVTRVALLNLKVPATRMHFDRFG